MNISNYFVNELKRGWFPCPNVIARSKLPPACKAVWIYMASQDSGWKFSAKTISKEIGLNPKTVNKALNELQHWGIFERERIFDRDKFGEILASGMIYRVKNPESCSELVPKKPLK